MEGSLVAGVDEFHPVVLTDRIRANRIERHDVAPCK